MSAEESEQRILRQLELIYDYVKFHIGLYLATPPVVLIVSGSLGVHDRIGVKVGVLLMIAFYIVSGVHAGLFMGRNINRKWSSVRLYAFEEDAFRFGRRFWHHWFYWIGLAAALLPILFYAALFPNLCWLAQLLFAARCQGNFGGIS